MQNQNISDIIEAYLKEILANAQQVEIRRSEIAELFNCVPSQINYVINTRFTIQRGYLVESKRGGGGYIRIVKVKLVDNQEFLTSLIEAIGDSLTERDALAITQKLYNEELISEKEGNLVLATLRHNTLMLASKPIEDQLRARIFKAVLQHLSYESE